MNHCFLASGTFSRTHGKEGMPKGPGLFKPAFRRSVSKVDPSKCQATSSGGQDSAAAGDSVEERIRRAREYRSKKDPAKTDFAAGPRVDSRSSSQRADTAVQDEFNQKLAQYGEEVALQQQETFVAALRDVQGNVQEPDTELSAQQILQQRQRQEDYIRRNAKHISPTLHARVQSNSVPAKPDTFSRSRESDSGAGPLDGPAIDDLQRRKSAMSGSDTTAATYLAKVAQDKSDIAGSRPEMFTILKDEEAKSRGVEMITRDRTYNPQKEDSSYKPKVSTWGVFPRPADISQAYGGGRTIRPGDPGETEERAKERSEKLKLAILEYRKRQGLFVDPEEEAKWMAAYQEGLELMQAGRLQSAAEAFDRVTKAVPPKTKLGGDAQLQRAICLDSAGRSDEAYKLYMTLERHPSAEIQKGAKRMLFGFRAAENLKTGKMSYSATPKEWEQYFTRFQGEYNTAYVDSGEVDNLPLYIAAAVLITPLIFAAYLILS